MDLKARLQNVGLNALVPVAALVIWEYVSRFSPLAPSLKNALPPPSVVLVSIWKLAANGVLAQDAGISILRLIEGFVIAACIAIPIGFAVGLSSTFDDFADPIIELLRPIPPPAWIPLGILWFGIGNAQNVFILTLGVFFPTVLNTIAGVRSVDRTLIWAVLTLGGSHKIIKREIVVPAAIPLAITGLRIGLGVGWGALVAAELLAARSGLGFLIESSRYAFDTPRMMTGMAAIGLVGFAMDACMRLVQRRITHDGLAAP